MHKNLWIGRLYLFLLLMAFFYILNGSSFCVASTAKLRNATRNIKEMNPVTELRDSTIYQEEIKEIKKDIELLREDLYQDIAEGYNRSREAIDRLINFIGVIATIFGIIIALGGIFIGFEGVRSWKRREEAIRTLEDAKSYVEGRVGEFDKIIAGKIKAINRKFEEFARISLEQLSKDTEEAARKVKEIEEKGITTEAEKKIELLEKRIKFFEEIGMPDDPRLLYSKAMVLKEKEMLKEGLELLERSVQFDPQYKTAYWQIGWIQHELGNHEKAVEAYDKASELDPKDASAYNNKGVALNKLNKKEEALECYNKAIGVDPKDTLYYTNKAKVLVDLGRREEAVENYDKAIELNPKEPSYCINKAKILEDLGRKEEALECYNKAIELNPKKPSYYINKAHILEELKGYKESLAIIEKAIEVNPRSSYLCARRGRILGKMGKIKEAVECYKEASEIEKGKIDKSDANEVDWLNYFEELLILGNYMGATDIKSKMKNKITRPDYLHICDFLSACSSFLQDKKADGIKQIFQIVENLEKNPLEKATTWEFEDINLFLRSNLHKDIYESCIAVEKVLLKEISASECKAKIQRMKSKA